MASQKQTLCSECGTSLRQDAPFCPECGQLPPSVVSKGALALELGDVPSQNTRGELLQLLKSWFPDFDAILAERRLRKGPTILMTGIDEESGARLLNALKGLKIQARLVDHRAEPWIKRLWNSGLAVSVVSLLLAVVFRGPAAFVFVLIAGGAPLAAALLIEQRRKPLLTQASLMLSAEPWIRLSRDYSQVIRSLASADATALKSLVTRVFEFQFRLKSASLASVAAGAETGELYKRLRDAVDAGIDISRNISSTEGEVQERSRQELVAFEAQVSKIDEWYRSLEDEGTRRTTQLVVELNDIVESIDRIVQEVRSSLGAVSPTQMEIGKVGL
ncbi:MAG: zinc ribbon domain-containing protein [Desulfomonilaceae bacterium]